MRRLSKVKQKDREKQERHRFDYAAPERNNNNKMEEVETQQTP